MKHAGCRPREAGCLLKKGRRLLVIDNSLRFATFISTVASELGFDVEITIRAEDFMAAVLRDPPDRIVLDIAMPEMDGARLIQWLAEQRIRGRVIMATGINTEYAAMVRAIGLAKGIDSIAVLLKPFRKATLKTALGKPDSLDPSIPSIITTSQRPAASGRKLSLA